MPSVWGYQVWEVDVDEEGHREYTLLTLVQSATTDGPAAILQTPGLALPGSYWSVFGDSDPWAICKANAKVSMVAQKTVNYWWTVEQKFSTKGNPKKCQDEKIEDPLLEPQKVSGSFLRSQKEAVYDRFGLPIKSSSHEQLRGESVKFDEMNPTVKIEQNVPDLQLPLLASMRNSVNDAPLWGMSARCVKVVGISWERLFHGGCYVYYKRSFDFEINDETFDRDVLDEGTKVLNGHWNLLTGDWTLDNIDGGPPNPNYPSHFNRYKDRNGENAKVILDGLGKPITDDTEPGSIHIEKYNEANLLLLGIPSFF